jgi:hypothetical protein
MSAEATTATVTTTASKLIDDASKSTIFNDGVIAYCIFNTDADTVVYVGGEEVTAGDGFPVPPNSTLSIDVPINTELWAVTSADTASVRVLKVA